jgi:MarR family transcriptional regulator, transcriptional regulator for hemolysin
MPQIPRERIGIALGRTSRLMRTKLDERLAPLGLTQAKWLILMHLSRNGGVMPQKELTESIGVEGPTVVRVLDGLERLGLVERRDQPADRRTKDVHLTPQASPILQDIKRITESWREGIWVGVSDEDLAACGRVLGTLLRNMGSHL